jgi:hypothetical protein
VRAASLPDANNAGIKAWRQAALSSGSDTRIPDPPYTMIADYTDNAVKIDVAAPEPGIVVLHDLFYPGWEAYVDGIGKPVLRANILFRGVEVPAGHHSISFVFRPLSLANLSAALSGLVHRTEE